MMSITATQKRMRIMFERSNTGMLDYSVIPSYDADYSVRVVLRAYRLGPTMENCKQLTGILGADSNGSLLINIIRPQEPTLFITEVENLFEDVLDPTPEELVLFELEYGVECPDWRNL